MKALRHTWYIAVKDLKIFFRDRTALFFFIVFPFMFIILFNFLLRGVGAEDQRLELHLVTREARGGISWQILEAMHQDQSELAPGEPLIVWDGDQYDSNRRAVENGDLAGFIAFPADFTQSLSSGTPTSLEVIASADDVNTRAALNGLARAISSRVGTDQVIIRASAALLVEGGAIPNDPAAIELAVQRMVQVLMTGGDAAVASYLTFATVTVGEVEAENPANYVIPGYLVMFVFFAAAVSAESIVRERRNHTLERLLATSVKREAILGGIFTGTFIRGVIQIAIFWVVGILAFKVDLGLAPAGVIILSVLMVIMSAAFSLMLATLARTQRSAGSLAVITSLVLAPLGGCWWPFFLYPAWLQNIARITPHAWANLGFNKLMVYGAEFGAAVPDMLALVGFTAVFGLIAVWRFRARAT